jgi:hypothetical protein
MSAHDLEKQYRQEYSIQHNESPFGDLKPKKWKT